MKNRQHEKGRYQHSLGLRISLSYALFLMRSLLWQVIVLSAVFWICACGNAAITLKNAADQWTLPDTGMVFDRGVIFINRWSHRRSTRDNFLRTDSNRFLFQ